MDLDEVAQYEPPHQDQRCLQILLFASLVVRELNHDLRERLEQYAESLAKSKLKLLYFYLNSTKRADMYSEWESCVLYF